MVSLTRRSFLGATTATGLLLATPSVALARSGRPVLTHGVQAGDPVNGSAVVWTRADRPSRMVVEVARDESFADALRIPGPMLTPETGFTGRVRVPTPGEDVVYRVTAEDDRTASEPVVGRLRVPRGAVRIQWSGDVVGQGFGINPELGGMTIFGAMADRRPDLFLHSGDTVYADGPLAETATLNDGRTWRNVVTPEKSKVAETLDEFRGQYAYNLTDAHYRRFAASVAQVNQWTDHEVTNNWYPGEVLTDPKYAIENRVDVLAARAEQAYREWVPLDSATIHRRIPVGPHAEVFVLDMRTFRDANGANTGTDGHILGAEQAAWLVHSLRESTARWKIVQSDMPIGIQVPDGDTAWEAVANGDPGAPSGREAEIARILAGIRGVPGVVWVTADVHYSAAIHYSPERAATADFDPFWEFVSGPLHAGAFPASPLDPTFGPEQVFVSAPPAPNTAPAEGFQHFGEIEIPADGSALRVSLRDQHGSELWTITL
jgi:alkaline phosphatase D